MSAAKNSLLIGSRFDNADLRKDVCICIYGKDCRSFTAATNYTVDTMETRTEYEDDNNCIREEVVERGRIKIKLM